MKFFGFENGIPRELTSRGGQIEITDQQAKQGCCSLQWDYQEGDELIFDTPIAYQTNYFVPNDYRIFTFGAYLFGFGQEGSLRVSYWKEEKEQCYFEICLGFRGWRSVMTYFEGGMQGTPVDGMDRMVISARGKGRLLLDELVTANRYDQRYVLKSYQRPENRECRPMNTIGWKLDRSYGGTELTDETLACITDRCEQYLTEEFVTGNIKDLSELEEKVQNLHIREGSMGLCGVKIETPNQRGIVADTEGAADEYLPVRKVTDLCVELAARYRGVGCERSKELYLLLLRYLLLQGVAEGSSFGTHCILDYGLRPLYVSLMLMREPIAGEGLLPEVIGLMRWFLHFGTMGFAEGIPGKKASTDDFFNCAQGMLFMILMMEDREEQAIYLKAYQNWLDRSMEVSDGLGEMFKEDGCIYHHHGHYIAYGEGGMNGIAPVVYVLMGTPFSVSDCSWENMKRTMEAIRFQCWGDRVPVAFCGRHPLGKMRLMKIPYKYFERAARLRGEVPVYGDAGNRSFHMACAAVHRRPGWLAVAKGFSKYLWGSEIYRGNNHYGRYRSYGVLELANGEYGGKMAFAHDGFDWNRFPGATTIHLPPEELNARIYNVDSLSGFEEDLFSDQSFAGSVSLGDNGMFSMILTEHPKYNGTHKAYKSIFFWNDFILLLGSGICNDSSYETETTLFQDSGEAGCMLLNGIPWEGTHVTREGDVLTDLFGNRYYMKEGTSIQGACGWQVSQSSTGSGETTGRFAAAVIRHGVSPKGASYEYGIGMAGAAAPAYQVLRQDEKAHIVRIGETTYYAVFDPEGPEEINTDVPLMVMVKETPEGLQIGVCDPDLGLYEEDPSQYDENGVRKEVSIYSRSWTIQTTPIRVREISLEIESLGIRETLQLKGGYTQTIKKENR